MQCEELKDLLPLLLVDLLGVEEELAVRGHLDAGCPACASEVAAARQTLDLLPLALPPETPATSVKSRLMAGVRKEETGRQQARAVQAPARRGPAGSVWGWVAAAGLGGALVGGIVTGSIMAARETSAIAALQDQVDSQNAAMAEQAAEMESIRSELKDASEAVRLVSAPSVKVFDMAARGTGMKGAARIFWDKAQSSWQMYASDLPPIAPDRTYQLWFITPTSKVSAGSFRPSADGRAGMRVQVPDDLGLIVAAAITEEPAGGSPQPTGTIRLLGQV